MPITLSDIIVSDPKERMDQNFFNRRFSLIVQAIADAQANADFINTTSQQLLESGITSLNETLAPLVTEVSNAVSLGFMVAGSSSTQTLIVGDEGIFTVAADAGRAIFQPTTFLTAVDNTNFNNYASLQLVSYNNSTGALVTNVLYVHGVVGPHDAVAAQTLSSNDTAWTNKLLRVVISASHLAAAGDHVRLTFTAASSGTTAVVGGAYVGIAAAGGNAYDFNGGEVPITVGGSLTFSVVAGTPVVSDWIALPVDRTKNLVVSIWLTSGDLSKNSAISGFTSYSSSSSTNISADVIGPGSMTANAGLYFVSRVEVEATATSITSSNWAIAASGATLPAMQDLVDRAQDAAGAAESANGNIQSTVGVLETLIADVAAGPVASVNGQTGVVVLDASDVSAESTANKGASNGYAALDIAAKVPLSQLPSSITGCLKATGTWNASTNSPTIVSGTGTQGTAFKVSVAGTTTIDGISSWSVGDYIFFDGIVWNRITGTVLPWAQVTGAPTTLAGYGITDSVLRTANNLSDVSSASTALGNLGGAAKSANLSDLSSATTALSNLGGLASSANAVASDVWAGTSTSKFVTPSAIKNTSTPTSVSFSSTITLDLSTGVNFTIGSITSSFTLANPTNPVVGYSGCILLPIGAASVALTKGSHWLFPGGTPTPSTTSSTTDAIFYYVASSTQILCNYVKAYA